MHRFSCKTLAGALAVAALLVAPAAVTAQDGGTVRGTVTLADNGATVHGAVVLVVGTGQFGLTADDGTFEILDVTPGSYEVLAQREHLTAGRQMLTVAAGGTATVNFELGLSPVHEDVTVTASAGGVETALEAFNSVTTLDSFDLVADAEGSLGDALRRQPGIASRSFGPGSSRPIIRGFDGDRVLILQDGIRTGDLSSQSGDHGVTIDPNTAERIEIVRGPATLLYGSNAVGGLVNVITPQDSYRDALFQGTRAQFSADAGSANAQAGTNASLQHAQDKLLFWAGGSVRRTGDYDTPEGTIENSATELTNARAGIGFFGDRFFASGGVTAEDGRFGVPFADEFHGHHDEHGHEDEHGHGAEEEAEEDIAIDIDSRRRVGRFDVGLRNLNNPIVDQVSLSLNVIDWNHDELNVEDGIESVGTRFDNRTYIVRADVEQRQTERLTGRFGAWTQVRDFEATGFEALAPRTDLTSFAAFAYEQVSFGPFRLQFGGRVERNDYRSMERTGGLHDHGDDDHDDDHGDDDHDDDHGDDDHDDDHGDDDHDDDHGDDDHDDDHGDDDHDDDHGDDDHDDDHGDDDHDDDHGDDDHDDDHGDDDHDDDHGDDDHDDDHGDDDHDDDHGTTTTTMITGTTTTTMTTGTTTTTMITGTTTTTMITGTTTTTMITGTTTTTMTTGTTTTTMITGTTTTMTMTTTTRRKSSSWRPTRAIGTSWGLRPQLACTPIWAAAMRSLRI